MYRQVEYKKDLENTKGHSINFCETPQFQNAAKVAKFTSDVSTKRLQTKHYNDNLYFIYSIYTYSISILLTLYTV